MNAQGKEVDDARREGESPVGGNAESLGPEVANAGGVEGVDPVEAPPADAVPRVQVVEWETTLVRGCEFVAVEVAVRYAVDAGDADVSARRLDTGELVDLRFEESEELASRAVRGDVP